MDGRVVHQGAAEGTPFTGVVGGELDRVFERGYCAQASPQAFLLELFHLVQEAFAFFADEMAARDAHAVEEDGGRVGAVHSQFAQRFADLDAGGAHGDDDEGFVAIGSVFVAGVDQEADPARVSNVGDPHFGAVDDVVVAVFSGAGGDRGYVGTGARFADADAGDGLAADGGHQEFFAQGVAAVRGERGDGGQVGTDGERDTGAVGVAQFFGGDHHVGKVQLQAAVASGLVDTEQSEFAGSPEEVRQRGFALLFPSVGVRIQFQTDKLADAVAHVLVFSGEKAAHFFSSGMGRTSRPAFSSSRRSSL
ncbi:hypothetical protein D3C71_1206610 [compost metagenome]